MNKRFTTICEWCYWGNTLGDDSAGKAQTWCTNDHFSPRTGESNWPIIKHCKDYEQSPEMPTGFMVNYALVYEFRNLVEQDRRCKVINVTEVVSEKVSYVEIRYPKEKGALISDYAFMTWISNPVFQRYYHESKVYQMIAEKYINEQVKKQQNEQQNQNTESK